MKIVIIGTSNSIMGEKGYVRALRQRHDVTNLSAGRVGIAFHLNRLLEHFDMIEAADLLIVDHYINDMNRYGGHLGNSYVADIETFYDMLRCLNTNVINLLFPFQPNEALNTRFYDVAANGTRNRNLCLVDLNKIDFQPIHFENEIHLTADASYFMGLILVREIARLEGLPKPSGGAIHATPFRRYTLAELAPDAKLTHQKNRLMAFDYLALSDGIQLPFSAEESLYGIGYFTPKARTAHQGIAIGPEQIALACEPGCYFHENLETTVKGPARLGPVLGPVLGEAIKLKTAMARGASDGRFESPCLVDITTRRHDIAFSGTPSHGTSLEIDMSGTIDALAHSVADAVKPSSIDYLRDLAIAEESHDLTKAHALMQIAAALRPEGHFIHKKLQAYKARLGLK